MKPSYLIHLSLSIGFLLRRLGGQSALVGYSELGASSVLAYSLRFKPCGDGKVRVVSKAGLHRHSARRASRASGLERSRPRELDAVPHDYGSGSTVDIGGRVAINLTAN
jgi:hypothetical protein